ncbi:MAG: hypothetical protein GX323_05340 [Clostridiales bacterium]|nr:hypothetical protein [Clostridiales bacterium]
MEGTILNKGIEGLKELKEKLIQLDRYQNDNSGLHGDEKRLEKSIKSKEASVEDEINSTVKKRKSEIEATYNQEISKVKEEIIKVQNKKAKSKNAQIKERIKIETSDLVSEYQNLKAEAKIKIKEGGVPSGVNSTLFYSLYMPRGVREIIIALLALVLVLLIVPCGIYFFVLPTQKVQSLIIIYVLTVILFGGIYIFVGNKIKYKYLPIIKEVRVIRTNMLKNKIRQDKIKKRILRDKDESVYSLDHYNKKISSLQDEIRAIEERKKEAIISFEKDTMPVIVDEIRGLHAEELLSMNTELIETNEKIRTNDEYIRNLSRELVENYEAYLGKEFMFVEKIDHLISLMENNGLENVSQAIASYKKEEI